MFLNRSISIAILFALILLMAFPVMAQEDVPTELVPQATPTETYDWAKEIGFASLFVSMIVSLAKHIPQLEGKVPSRTLALALNLAIWLGLMIFREMGHEGTFIDTVSNFGKLFQLVGNIVATYLGASAIYTASSVSGFPIMGKKRS